MSDLFKAWGIVCLFFLMFSPLFYCASKLDQQSENRAKELGCADGASFYLSPLSREPHYKSCKTFGK